MLREPDLHNHCDNEGETQCGRWPHGKKWHSAVCNLSKHGYGLDVSPLTFLFFLYLKIHTCVLLVACIILHCWLMALLVSALSALSWCKMCTGVWPLSWSVVKHMLYQVHCAHVVFLFARPSSSLSSCGSAVLPAHTLRDVPSWLKRCLAVLLCRRRSSWSSCLRLWPLGVAGTFGLRSSQDNGASI